MIKIIVLIVIVFIIGILALSYLEDKEKELKINEPM